MRRGTIMILALIACAMLALVLVCGVEMAGLRSAARGDEIGGLQLAQLHRTALADTLDELNASGAALSVGRVLLADEPTGNLDSVNGVEVMELLSELNRQGTTIIIVTHSQRDATYAHRIIRLLDGQIVSENINRPLEKSTSSKNEAV